MGARTTIVLDTDIAEKLDKLRHATQKTFRELVNETLRKGLSLARSPKNSKSKFVVRAKSLGFQQGIDPHDLKIFLEEDEIQHFVKKTVKGKQ